MKVVIPDDDRGHWESLRRSLEQESEIQLSGIAADAETASHSVIARELRRILRRLPDLRRWLPRSCLRSSCHSGNSERRAECRTLEAIFWFTPTIPVTGAFVPPGPEPRRGYRGRLRLPLHHRTRGDRNHALLGGREEPPCPPARAKMAAPPLPSSADLLAAIPLGRASPPLILVRGALSHFSLLPSQIRRYKPAIPPRILNSRGAVAIGRVAWRLNRTRARTQRSRINRIRIRNIHV